MLRILLLLSLLPFALFGISKDITNKKSSGKLINPVYNYECSPYVSPEVWERVKPYLLPSNHPLKPRLDKIFGSKRVTANLKTLKEAGFARVFRRNFSFTVVSPHPSLKGYFVKMYTDEEADVLDYEKWITRVEGANEIRKFITEHNLVNLFKVPQKWIYPLPPEPSPPAGSHRKNFILVVEDMGIYRNNDNTVRWKKYMTPERLKYYYAIVNTFGLMDNVMAFNCPFCLDGRQAFIDTEWNHKWPIDWDRMMPYLTPSVQTYFREQILK